MDFALTEEQEMIRDAARDFAASEVAPHAIQLENTHAFPAEMTQKMAEMGFMGLVIPEKFGGSEVDYLSYLLVEHEMAKVSISLSMTLGAQNSLVALPLMGFASEELQAKYLPKLASGEYIGCFALTEPGAGSDPAGMTTTAEKRGDKWVINGTKLYITNGAPSKLAIVWARTGTRENGKPEQTAFLVDREMSPYQTGTIEEKMGVHASPTTELIFEECEIPESHMIGTVGGGLKLALMTLNTGRVSVCAQSLGLAIAAYERAKKFSMEREQFGQKIAQFQAISFKLADMITNINAAKTLVKQAVDFKEAYGLSDPRFISLAAQAKLFTTEMATRVCNEAIQIHGGYGYMKEYRVEEFFRAAKLMELVEGTSEIQRLTIARSELGA